MNKRHKNIPLDVLLNGRHVGVYQKHSGGEVSFTYDQTWLEWRHAMAISLSLPLQVAPHRGSIVDSYFENLLPDNIDIIKTIAQRFGARGTDAYNILSQIGRDCVGALQFIPEGYVSKDEAPQTYEALTDAQIAEILNGLESVPLGLSNNEGFRISLAGAQEKTALTWHNGVWCKPTGLLPTTHIFKPEIGNSNNKRYAVDYLDSVENEYYCLKLLNAFGIETAKTQIANYDNIKALIIKRFDRIISPTGKISRLPQEDMCQALGYPSSLKYQSDGGPAFHDILKLLEQSDTPQKDQQTLMKCQILFYLIAATDGHAKNFSIFLRPGNRVVLTPIYDVLSTQPAFDANMIAHKDFRLAMGLGKRNHYRIKNIEARHFYESAQKTGLDNVFVSTNMRYIEDAFEAAFKTVEAALPKGFPMHIHNSIKTAAAKRLIKIAQYKPPT